MYLFKSWSSFTDKKKEAKVAPIFQNHGVKGGYGRTPRT
jgi:hypothetical protein